MTFDTWVSVCVSDWRGRVNYLCTNVPCQCSTRQIPCSILLMLHSMNLQERVVRVMLAVRESWLSSVTPRFLAFWVGVNTELSKLIVRSWVGEPFPGRKGSSVFSRFIFRWCADIHREMSVRHLPVFQIGEKRVQTKIHTFSLRSVTVFYFHQYIIISFPNKIFTQTLL